MPCFHPWRKDEQVLPCGQCRGCRATYAREWQMRCMHEASLYEDNCFVTLTYDDDHLPPGGSLDGPVPGPGGKPGAFAFFMKRLRKAIKPQKVRYFHVGEYGDINSRPHYHALLFGFDPPGKALLTVRGGFPVFTSELLRATWTDGLHEIGCVTSQSAGYVVRYLKKRITGKWAKARYGDKEPEYGTMSRNPGIGAGWIDAFRDEVFPADSVVVGGRFWKPPRYYAERVGRRDELLIEDVKCGRFQARKPEDETAERLAVREKCLIAKENLLKGGTI